MVNKPSVFELLRFDSVPMSKTHFHGLKDVRAITIRLHLLTFDDSTECL